MGGTGFLNAGGFHYKGGTKGKGSKVKILFCNRGPGTAGKRKEEGVGGVGWRKRKGMEFGLRGVGSGKGRGVGKFGGKSQNRWD